MDNFLGLVAVDEGDDSLHTILESPLVVEDMTKDNCITTKESMHAMRIILLSTDNTADSASKYTSELDKPDPPGSCSASMALYAIASFLALPLYDGTSENDYYAGLLS